MNWVCKSCLTQIHYVKTFIKCSAMNRHCLTLSQYVTFGLSKRVLGARRGPYIFLVTIIWLGLEPPILVLDHHFSFLLSLTKGQRSHLATCYIVIYTFEWFSNRLIGLRSLDPTRSPDSPWPQNLGVETASSRQASVVSEAIAKGC